MCRASGLWFCQCSIRLVEGVGQAMNREQRGRYTSAVSYASNMGGHYSVLSLFSGAGGMDLGFVGGFSFLGKEYPKTGFRVVKAYDINPRAVETYNANLEPVCEVKDVATLDPSELPTADVVIGGFPCQDFSLAGKRQGIRVHRGNLYKALVIAVEAT